MQKTKGKCVAFVTLSGGMKDVNLRALDILSNIQTRTGDLNCSLVGHKPNGTKCDTMAKIEYTAWGSWQSDISGFVNRSLTKAGSKAKPVITSFTREVVETR